MARLFPAWPRLSGYDIGLSRNVRPGWVEDWRLLPEPGLLAASMYQRTTVTMSPRELDRLKVIQAVVDGELRAGLAAERLGLCAASATPSGTLSDG